MITTEVPMPAATATAVAVVPVVSIERTRSHATAVVPQSVSARVALSELRPEFAMERVKPTHLTAS